MKTISLGRNGWSKYKHLHLQVMVDNEDYDFLNQWNWGVVKHHNNFYAIRHEKIGNKKKSFYMHRVILKLENQRKIVCDHIDRNSLNNQKSNLRRCSQRENSYNTSSTIGSSSKYVGVGWDKTRNKWMGYVSYKGKFISVGRFDKEEDAAKARDKKALELHGEFANINIK